MSTFARILTSQFILAVIIANILFVDGVFLKEIVDTARYKKIIFGAFIVIGAVALPKITYLSVAFVFIWLVFGVKLLRSRLKMPSRHEVRHSVKPNYYAMLYWKEYLKPVFKILIFSLPFTLFVYVISLI